MGCGSELVIRGDVVGDRQTDRQTATGAARYSADSVVGSGNELVIRGDIVGDRQTHIKTDRQLLALHGTVLTVSCGVWQ